MTLVSLPYFPNIAWFAVVAKSDKVLLEKNENFTKQTYRNRTVILSPNGPQNLVVPVIGGRSKNKVPIDRIRIDYSHSWVSKHLNSIKTAYGSAPFFIHYFDDIRELLRTGYQTLFELNTAILEYLASVLQLDTQFQTTEQYLTGQQASQQNIKDLRKLIDPDFKPATGFPPYQQVFRDKFGFVPNLSILDLLFNLGPEAVVYLKNLKTGEL